MAQARAGPKPAVIDGFGLFQGPTRVGDDEIIQIEHHSIAVKEGVHLELAVLRLADNLAEIVDSIGCAVRTAASHSSQIYHLSVAIQERAAIHAGRPEQPNDLSAIIDSGGLAGSAPERAQETLRVNKAGLLKDLRLSDTWPCETL